MSAKLRRRGRRWRGRSPSVAHLWLVNTSLRRLRMDPRVGCLGGATVDVRGQRVALRAQIETVACKGRGEIIFLRTYTTKHVYGAAVIDVSYPDKSHGHGGRTLLQWYYTFTYLYYTRKHIENVVGSQKPREQKYFFVQKKDKITLLLFFSAAFRRRVVWPRVHTRIQYAYLIRIRTQTHALTRVYVYIYINIFVCAYYSSIGFGGCSY